MFTRSETTRTRSSRSTREFRLGCESLEDRRLMAGLTASVSNGVLDIMGTNGNDQIVVRQLNGVIRIDNTAIRVGNTNYAGINANSIQQIRVVGGAGNDFINLASERVQGQQPIMKPASIWGGAGDDVIYGTAANDRIFGGLGNDILIGGFGSDILYGEEGNDTLVGDSLNANGQLMHTANDGNDYLVGGAGVDRFFGQGGFDWYHDDFNATTPFVNGAQVTDVSQKELGTCATLAAMTALVRQGHDFGRQISYLGNNQFGVTLYRNGNPIRVTVQYNGWWNDNDPKVMENGYTSSEYWPILLQRARLQMYGVDWSRGYTEQQFAAIHQATGNRLCSLQFGLQDLCGRQAYTYGTNQINPNQLLNAFRNGFAITVGTVAGINEQVHRMVSTHAYAVMNIFQQNGRWMIQLHNPWGVDSSFGDRGDGRNDGFVTLQWSEYLAYFNHLSIA